MSKRLIFALLLLALAAASCSSPKKEQTIKARSEIEKGPWLMTLSSPAKEYKTGDPIGIVFNVRNQMELPLILKYRNGHMYDFRVLKGKTEVYRWSKGRDFSNDEIEEEVLPFHETKLLTEWDQKSNGGNLVKPGTYTIKGSLTPQVLSDEVEITVTIKK